VFDSFHRLQQFLVHRTRKEAAHPFRTRHTLQLFRRGSILLQFVIEHGGEAQGLGLDVGDLSKANFDRLGMARTNLVWHNGLDANFADGWNDRGQSQPHDKRGKVRAAGSMNTAISYLSKFAARPGAQLRTKCGLTRRNGEEALEYRLFQPIAQSAVFSAAAAWSCKCFGTF